MSHGEQVDPPILRSSQRQLPVGRVGCLAGFRKIFQNRTGVDRVYARRRHRTALRAVVTVTAGLAWTTLLQIYL